MIGSEGFIKYTKRAKSAKIKECEAFFTGLGGFAGDCEGGVRCDRKSEIADMRF